MTDPPRRAGRGALTGRERLRLGYGGALLAALALLTAPLSAQTVEGYLRDGVTREPVASGVLSLLAEEGEVLARVEADSAGYFSIDVPRPGSYYLRAERIGYATKTDGILELGRDARVEVDFYLLTRPVELEGLEATGERTDWIEERLRRRLEAQGFYDRQERGFGHFITPEEIEERPPTRPRDLFRMIPRMETGDVIGRPGSDGLVAMDCGAATGGRDTFHAYVNGIRVHDGRVWDMRSDISMDDITAVEVYTGPAAIPLQYNMLGACGVILIWTK